jgi:ubiquinone/menaquinone biosynthesis C-methylase UbiE
MTTEYIACATETASLDVAVFCLALMGTDYPSFLEEASRVLKLQGILWIAEVCLRGMTLVDIKSSMKQEG